jgi:hypothetical protein
MIHKVLPTPTGLHSIIDNRGRVHIFTEEEYTHMTWWTKVKLKYKLN